MNSSPPHRPVRVRFAPAPTGMMHLGNVRQALINLIFARQHNGSFILRIEDTDAERLFDHGAEQIQADLAWLGISYDEGPGKNGVYGPYFQSQRTALYAEHLEILHNKEAIYRCFCTPEDLEKKRTRQIELKKAPRYDRTCLKLSADDLAEREKNHVPSIWRIKLEPITVQISDLVRGTITFDLNNFTDFPLTRQDGSFTFIFANCVDDITMEISHVFRGEDHLSNAANQAMLYHAFDAQLPLFWHTPIICNKEGKKLSKRDFGFSLDDLRTAGFVPEAIINYLATIGGKTHEQEIMDLDELIQKVNFTQHGTANTIRYDEDKLRWTNQAWIKKLPLKIIAERCRPFLERAYPAAAQATLEMIEKSIAIIRPELTTLADCVPLLQGLFNIPSVDHALLAEIGIENYRPILHEVIAQLQASQDKDTYLPFIKEASKRHNITSKPLWGILRVALTGSPQGTSIANIFALLDTETILTRLKATVHTP